MSAANLTKRQLIDAIIAAQGKNHAPRAYLQGRTIEQLRKVVIPFRGLAVFRPRQKLRADAIQMIPSLRFGRK